MGCVCAVPAVLQLDPVHTHELCQQAVPDVGRAGGLEHGNAACAAHLGPQHLQVYTIAS